MNSGNLASFTQNGTSAPLDPAELRLRGELLDEANLNENTEEAYQRAQSHYLKVTGKHLPCTVDEMLAYLTLCAGKYKPSAIRSRCYHISGWHRKHQFPIPRNEKVNLRLKAINKKYYQSQKQAKALNEFDLEAIVDFLERDLQRASTEDSSDHPKRQLAKQLQAIRDKALFLTGFWFALRSDNLVKMKVQDLSFNVRNDGLEYLEIKLPQTKTGEMKLSLPSLPRLCPVQALKDWIYAAHMADLPTSYIFSPVGRWGNIKNKQMHHDSIIPLIRSRLEEVSINPDQYSSHSLRRGFASWAVENGASTRELMEWVGWHDAGSAIRYTDSKDDLPYALMQDSNSAQKASAVLEDIIYKSFKGSRIEEEEKNRLLTALNDIKRL